MLDPGLSGQAGSTECDDGAIATVSVTVTRSTFDRIAVPVVAGARP